MSRLTPEDRDRLRAAFDRQLDVGLHEGAQLAVYVDGELAAETRRLAQVLILDLMTESAGDTVDGQGVKAMLLIQKPSIEQQAVLRTGLHGREARHRRVTGGALVLDDVFECRMVEHLGSDRGLPVGVAGSVGHDGPAPILADGDVVPLLVEEVRMAAGTRPGAREEGRGLSGQRRGVVGR